MRDLREMKRYWRNRRVISRLEREALLGDESTKHLWGL